MGRSCTAPPPPPARPCRPTSWRCPWWQSCRGPDFQGASPVLPGGFASTAAVAVAAAAVGPPSKALALPPPPLASLPHYCSTSFSPFCHHIRVVLLNIYDQLTSSLRCSQRSLVLLDCSSGDWGRYLRSFTPIINPQIPEYSCLAVNVVSNPSKVLQPSQIRPGPNMHSVVTGTQPSHLLI